MSLDGDPEARNPSCPPCPNSEKTTQSGPHVHREFLAGSYDARVAYCWACSDGHTPGKCFCDIKDENLPRQCLLGRWRLDRFRSRRRLCPHGYTDILRGLEWFCNSYLHVRRSGKLPVEPCSRALHLPCRRRCVGNAGHVWLEKSQVVFLYIGMHSRSKGRLSHFQSRYGVFIPGGRTCQTVAVRNPPCLPRRRERPPGFGVRALLPAPCTEFRVPMT